MPLIKRLSLNAMGRDLLIGDIHGHFAKARAALDAVGFNPEVDRVISVGDLVDRGPESEQALEWLAQPWFHAVRGNHEQMCMDPADAYLHMANGGVWFVSKGQDERQPFVDAFRDLPVAIELETTEGLVGIVHADPVAPTWERVRQLLSADEPEEGFVQALIWTMDRVMSEFGEPIPDIRAVVVGHTPMERVTSLGNVIYIDTGGWLPEARCPGRVFTVLDAETLAPAYRQTLASEGWAS